MCRVDSECSASMRAISIDIGMSLQLLVAETRWLSTVLYLLIHPVLCLNWHHTSVPFIVMTLHPNPYFLHQLPAC